MCEGVSEPASERERERNFKPNLTFRIYLFLVIWRKNLSDVLHVLNNFKLFIFSLIHARSC